MELWLVLSLLGLFLVICLDVFWRFRPKGRHLHGIPGPRSLPIVGNLHQFVLSHEALWTQMHSWNERYYPFCKFWCGPLGYVNLQHPEDIEKLLSSQQQITKGSSYEHMASWLSTGLLTSTGSKWRTRRKVLTTAFHFSILGRYLEISEQQNRRALELLSHRGEEFELEIGPFCSDYTLGVICEAAMGVEVEKMEAAYEKYKLAVRDIGAVIIDKTIRPYLPNWLLNSPLFRFGRVERRALKVLHEFTRKIIDERRRYHQETGFQTFGNPERTDEVTEEENTLYGRKKRFAMLDLLLSAERDGLIDAEGIQEEVDTFTFEGHDTSGMGLTFAIFLLAENPDHQELARLEVQRVCGDKSEDQPMTLGELQQMEYLERCIKESLRLYPPVHVISRTLSHDLQTSEHLVPAGTDVYVYTYDVHRDKRYWIDPEHFDPDRFLPENCRGRHAFCYLPFSAGPRNCIGQKFAMNELKSILARLLLNFRIESVRPRHEELDFKFDIIIRSRQPIYARFRRI